MGHDRISAIKPPLATLVAVAATIGIVPINAQRAPTPPPASHALPGLVRFKSILDFWSPPWVFVQRGSGTTATRALHNRPLQEPGGSIALRLDDGSIGSLTVTLSPIFDHDRENLRIQVFNSRSEMVTAVNLNAPYGEFEIAPIDLVDNPADELLIVRIKTHASPPTGHNLTIWKLSPPTLMQISDEVEASNLLGTSLIGCAGWKTSISVNPTEKKPRMLSLRSTFGVDARVDACRPDEAQLTELKRPRRLRFDGSRYQLK